jgi:hypothetical protein
LNPEKVAVEWEEKRSYYPPGIDKTNETLVKIVESIAGKNTGKLIILRKTIDHENLESIGKAVEGRIRFFECKFTGIVKWPASKDNYIWLYAVNFRTSLGEISVVLPEICWTEQHGWRLERSAAIFQDGESKDGPSSLGVFSSQINEILEKFNAELLKSEREIRQRS